MYVNKKDLDFIFAALDQINSIIESSPSDIEYWQELIENGSLLQKKMSYQSAKQKFKSKKKS